MGGMAIGITLAFSYLGNIELDIKSAPALADQPPQLKKEVINTSTDNVVATVNTASPGDRLKYRLTYSNPSGNAEVTNAKLLDVLPNDVVLVTVTDGGIYSSADNSASWVIPRIAAGGNGVVNYEVKVNSVPDDTVIGNTAYLTAASYPQGVKSNEVKTTVSAPTITLEAVSDKTIVKRGEKIIYTITIKNTGSVEAQAVRARDVLPTEVSFLESNITPSSIEGNIVEFNLNNMAPEAVKAITLTALIGKNAASDSTIINNIIVNYSDKNNIVYPDVLKGVSASIGTGAVTPGAAKDNTPAPKTGGNIVISLIMSLMAGIIITLFFFYNHEPLSFAGAKISIFASRKKIGQLQKNYLSGASLKLQLESWKIRLKRMI